MIHQFNIDTIQCPNCKNIMLSVKYHPDVFVCVSKTCCFITGPDVCVQSYFKSLEKKAS